MMRLDLIKCKVCPLKDTLKAALLGGDNDTFLKLLEELSDGEEEGEEWEKRDCT